MGWRKRGRRRCWGGKSESGATGQQRFCAPLVLLRVRWKASGGPGEVAWSDFCDRSPLALGFRLDLDKGCGSGEREERGYI